MFSTKITFKGPDFDIEQDKIIEYPARTFPEALQLAETMLDYNKRRPLTIEILEDRKLVASLRTVR